MEFKSLKLEIFIPETHRKCIAIAHNLRQTRKLLEEIQAGTSKYDIIRLQA